MRPAWTAALLALLVLTGTASAITSSGLPVTNPDGSESWPNLFSDVDVNAFVGAQAFYNLGYSGSRATMANVEAGYVWGQHDVFLYRNGTITQVQDPAAVGGYDYHATMVGHVLAGDSPMITVEWWPGVYFTYKPAYGDQFTVTLSDGTTMPLSATLWFGMAPRASFTSAAIATSWVHDGTTEYGGEFETSAQTVYTAYHTTMSGTPTAAKANVINSSWGGEDPAGTDSTTRLIDALAYANHTTVCLAAGNTGSQVWGPASGYNSITVGALAYDSPTHPYHAVSDFSSRGPNDFYNPRTGTIVPGVRAAVDLVAPGENFTLACYGGLTGGHDPSGTDPTLDENGIPSGGYYFIGASGTSFASPIVAGGAALLVDMGKARFANDRAIDGRVIKAVLMNSAAKIEGWDNGQQAVANPAGLGGTVISTTQSLDYASGAGRLDLARARIQYTAGSPDSVTGDGLTGIGWSLGTIQPGAHNDYMIAELVDVGTKLTATLDWFVNLVEDGTTGREVQFANLDLEVWKLSGLHGAPDSLVAESASVYNNVEHLAFDAPAGGYYMLRVKWSGENYGLSDPTAETYAVAWSVPEPATLVLLTAGAVLAAFRRNRKAL